MTRLLLALFLTLGASVSFTGCATERNPDDPNQVSSLPWNRPERWEGSGPLGGMMNSM